MTTYLVPSRRHIISAGDFDRIELITIFTNALVCKELFENPRARGGLQHILAREGQPLCCAIVSDKPSLRTLLECELAIKSLGGTVERIEFPFSSAREDEGFQSTLTLLGLYYGLVIVRHSSDPHAAKTMAAAADRISPMLSVINAGCGADNVDDTSHPLQMVTDLLTIFELRKDAFLAGNLTYAIVGGVWNRATRSLIDRISCFGGNVVVVASPRERTQLMEWASNRYPTLIFTVQESLAKARDADVYYFTQTNERWRGVHYQVTDEVLAGMKEDAIVLHPLPCGPEFPQGIHLCDRRFLHLDSQIQNGLFAKMGLFKFLFAPHMDLPEEPRVMVMGVIDGRYLHGVEVVVRRVSRRCVIDDCLFVELDGKYWVTLCGPIEEEKKRLSTKGATLCLAHRPKPLET